MFNNGFVHISLCFMCVVSLVMSDNCAMYAPAVSGDLRHPGSQVISIITLKRLGKEFM